jgi:hypothetical protein
VRTWEEEGVTQVGGEEEVRSWFVKDLKEAMDRVRTMRAERDGKAVNGA